MKISDGRFVVVDTESTGIDYAAGDRIVEFAGLRYPGGDSLTMLVNPGRDIPPASSGIHHLTSADVENAVPIETAMLEIRNFVAPNDIVIAHNAEFDLSMLPCLADRRWLCTKRLAQHLYPNAPNFKNQTLRYWLGGAHVAKDLPAHRALADAQVTAFVLCALIEEFIIQGHADDVDELLAFAASPIRYTHMPIGKHRDEPMGAVPLSYLAWLIGPRGMSDLYPDLRHSVEHEIRRRRNAPQEHAS